MLGRLHDTEGIRRAFNNLRGGGATNVNLDLMYGLPRQDMATWQTSLNGAAELEPDHFSLYALTVEESTPFHGWVESGRLPSPDPDLAADMYEAAEERMAQSGMDQYEISNWARSGYECRHNLAYWFNSPLSRVRPRRSFTPLRRALFRPTAAPRLYQPHGRTVRRADSTAECAPRRSTARPARTLT